jgi:hypothetical protein
MRPAEPISLADARRRREAKTERVRLALVVQAEPGAVRLLVGTTDGVEFGLSPELADEIAEELARAAREARGT